MTVLENFERWKEFLGEKVDAAKSMGMSNEQITNVATKMGEFLADKVDPKNEQERLLQELWNCGEDEDRKTLAKLMVRMSDKAH